MVRPENALRRRVSARTASLSSVAGSTSVTQATTSSPSPGMSTARNGPIEIVSESRCRAANMSPSHDWKRSESLATGIGALDRWDGVLAVGARHDAGRVSAEALDQLIPEVLRLHHVVDDEVRRELVEVDVLAILVLELLALGRPLALRKLRQLVKEDRVDRRLRTHHRDLRRGQREHGVGVERWSCHLVDAGAISHSHDD